MTVERYLRERYILVAILFIAFSFFVNFQVLFNSFSVDDFILIVHNVFAQDIKNLPEILSPKNFFNILPVRLGARPFFIALLIGQFYFFKLNPLGYHFVSIIFHILNSLIIFIIAFKLTGKKLAAPAILAAAAFAFSPVMLESVAVISFQAYVFSTFFCLSAFYFFLRALDSAQRGSKPFFYFLCFVFTAAAFFIKENSIIMPAVMLAYILMFKARDKKALTVIFSICALSVLFFVYFWLPRFPVSIFSTVYTNVDGAAPVASLQAYLNGIFLPLLHNIKTLFFPFNLSLDYTIYISGKSLNWIAVFIAAAGALFACKIKNKTIKFLIIFAAFAYLPISNIVPLVNTVSDRYLYFVMAPCALLLGAALNAVRRKSFYKYAVVGVLCIIIIWAFSYRARAKVFFNNHTVYANAVEKYPSNPRGYYNLAVSYMSRGMFAEALENLNKVSEISPFYKTADVLFLKGESYIQLGNAAAARENILKSAIISGENHHVKYFFTFFNNADEAMEYLINKFKDTVIDKKTFLYFVNFYNSTGSKKFIFDI
jgi:tetratricopeptide (TPR) repeat protein